MSYGFSSFHVFRNLKSFFFYFLFFLSYQNIVCFSTLLLKLNKLRHIMQQLLNFLCFFFRILDNV